MNNLKKIFLTVLMLFFLLFSNLSFVSASPLGNFQQMASISAILENLKSMLSALKKNMLGSAGGSIFSSCGDKICDAGESCSSCSVDCGVCPITDGLVSQWKFEENLQDEVGNNSGSFAGDAKIVDDSQRGKVLSLDGSGDYAEITESVSLAYANNFTVSGWVYLKNSNMSGIFSRGRYGKGWQLFWLSDRLRFQGSFGGVGNKIYTGGTGSVLNTWKHILFTFDSSNKVSVYLDGKFSFQFQAQGPVDYLDAHKFQIGGADSAMNGMLDDVAIYNRVLNAKEIQAIYDRQAGIVWPPVLSAYYVSPDGDDSNPGTLNQPLKTIQKARDTIRWHDLSGVTVYIREGTYYFDSGLEFTSEDSGASGKPNIYTAYNGEKVVIKGSKKIPAAAFTIHSGNILKADLSSYEAADIYQVFMNSKRLINARYPNYDSSDPIKKGWLFAAAGTSKQVIKYNEGDFNPSSWDISNARLDIFLGPNYGNYLMNVSSIDSVAKTITYSSTRGARANNRYYFQNIFQELDVKNEWYYDKNAKILYLYPEHPLTVNDEVSVPLATNLVIVNGADYLEFRGLSIEETAGRHPWDKENFGNCVYIKNSKNITIDGCKISNSETSGVFVTDSLNVTVKNSEIFETGSDGVYLRDSADYFKQLKSTNYLVTGNTFHDNGAVEIGSGEGGSGVLSTTVGSVISYNHVYNEPRIGIMLYAANDNIVEYNNVHDLNLKTEDTSSIYTIPENCTQRGNIIRNNYIKGSGGLGVGSDGKIFTPNYSFGIYLDNGASGVKVQGNTIVDTYRAAVYINGGRDNIIDGNMIVENRTQQQILFGSRSDTSCWNFLQSFESQGYNKALFFQKYPELNTIQQVMSNSWVGYNQIINNKIIYPKKSTTLYAAGSLDYSTTKINNNTIWQGPAPISVGIGTYSWSGWKAEGFDSSSVLVDDLFKNSIYNTSYDDDYSLQVNLEKQSKSYSFPNACDLNGNVLGSFSLAPFESKLAFNCFCNNDKVCNNKETRSTCPGDCSATCSDGIKNQDETDVDCGGITCSKCDLAKICTKSSECSTGYCFDGACAVADFPADFVSYWKFSDNLSDENIFNPGSFFGDAKIVDDPERGKVLSLDGTGDYVTITENIPLNYVNNFTFSGWFYKKDTGMRQLFSRTRSQMQEGIQVYSMSDRVRVEGKFGGIGKINTGAGIINPNGWHHAVIVFDSANKANFYLDGVLKSSIQTPGSVDYLGSHKFYIGGPSGYSWYGMIDDVMVYSRALSVSEISALFTGQQKKETIFVSPNFIETIIPSVSPEPASSQISTLPPSPVSVSIPTSDVVPTPTPTPVSTPISLPSPPPPTCSDTIQNQGEAGIDCGGPCPSCNIPVQAGLPLQTKSQSQSQIQKQTQNQQTQSQIQSAPAQVSSFASMFTKSMYQGTKHEEVSKLQKYLARDSFYPEKEITGYFGELTMEAVRKFQCKYGIVCEGTAESTGYGLVGSQTRKKLNEVYGSQSIPEIASNQANAEVVGLLQEQIKILQQKLIELLSELAKLLQVRIGVGN